MLQMLALMLQFLENKLFLKGSDKTGKGPAKKTGLWNNYAKK